MAKGGGGSSNQTTTSSPWEGIIPYLTGGTGAAQPGIYPQAGHLFEGSRGAGDIFAGFDPSQTQGQNQQLDYANQMQGQLQPYQQAASFGLGGAQGSGPLGQAMDFGLSGALDPNSNPYLENYMQAATRPLQQQLDLQTMPGIGRQFTGAGQYGSSRQGVSEGVAQGLTSQAIGDVRAQIGSAAYGQGLDQQSRALSLGLGQQQNAMRMMPQMLQAGLMPSQLTQDVGAQRQNMQQRRLDEPFENLGRYASLIQPGAGIGGSVSTPVYRGGGGLLGGLGGGLMGMGIGQGLGQGGQAPGGNWPWILGGALGGLTGG